MNVCARPIVSADLAIRKKLATAYRIIAGLGWDDMTYTHLTARSHEGNSYFVLPFGMLFAEVTADNLIEVNLDGKVVDQKDQNYNSTGYVVHGSLYRARMDLNASFHLHTIDGVAISSTEQGLLPLSQFALHFYNRISRHGYNSLALGFHSHGSSVVKDLGTDNKAMILDNHGTLTCGATIQEAMLYTYFLEKACQVQNKILSSGCVPIQPSEAVCEQSAQDLRNFEKDFGLRDWQAWERQFFSGLPV